MKKSGLVWACVFVAAFAASAQDYAFDADGAVEFGEIAEATTISIAKCVTVTNALGTGKVTLGDTHSWIC